MSSHRLPAPPLRVRAAGLALALAAGAGLATAAEVQMRGGRVSIRAEGEMLSGVLGEFEKMGVRARMDPAIDRRVTLDLRDRDADAAMRALLEPYGYTLSWTVVSGPADAIPRLDEIRVFPPGRPDRAKPLSAGQPKRALSGGVDGALPLHVDREILLVLTPGATTAEFLGRLAKWNASLIDAVPRWGVYRIRLPEGADMAEWLRVLAADPLIARAEANYAERLPSAQTHASASSASAGMPVAAADPSSPRVAVFDTGLTLPSGWEIALAGVYDATGAQDGAADTVGHGTQMALLASGAVLPDGAPPTGTAQVLAVRTFDADGATSNFDMLRAIDYAIASGASVLSLSWGTETPSAFIRDAIAGAQAGGMIVVAAAGNEPTGATQYPAAYPGVIGVSALTPSGAVWDPSNYGDFVFAAAPGVAHMPVGYNGPPGRYAGTSAATAYTAGILAQWLARNPGSSPEQAAAALQSALTDIGAPGRDPRTGHGALDATAVARLLGGR